jgi:hypothetical protein
MARYVDRSEGEGLNYSASSAGGSVTPSDPTRQSMWGNMSPDSKFNAISGLASMIESAGNARTANKLGAVNALAQPYTGQNVGQVQQPSLVNNLYAYNLAERRRKEAEEQKQFQKDLLSKYQSILEMSQGKKTVENN